MIVSVISAEKKMDDDDEYFSMMILSLNKEGRLYSVKMVKCSKRGSTN